MQIGQHWNVDESVYYSVHHDQFGVDSTLVEGLLFKVSNHLAGAASGSVVPKKQILLHASELLPVSGCCSWYMAPMM